MSEPRENYTDSADSLRSTQDLSPEARFCTGVTVKRNWVDVLLDAIPELWRDPWTAEMLGCISAPQPAAFGGRCHNDESCILFEEWLAEETKRFAAEIGPLLEDAVDRLFVSSHCKVNPW